MRKKMFFIPVVFLLALMTGCTSAGKAGDSGEKPENLAQYVTLGSIRDLDVEYTKTKVTEEDIQEAIDEDLEASAEYIEKNAPAEAGDTVDVYISATSEDGEVIYDFTDDPYDMTIGDAEWGEEFDALLIGKSAGDSGTYTASYDADYDDFVMSGHTVTIDYTIDKVCDTVVPELDEKFLTEMGYDSEEAYRKSIIESLEEDYEYSDRQTYIQNLMEAVKENSVFSDIPANVISYARELVEAGYEDYADTFGCELSEVYDMFGITKDDLDDEAFEYAEDLIVTDAIRVSEGIELDSTTYDNMLKSFMDEEGYSSMTEVYEDYDKTELEDYFLDQLVKDYLVSVNE